jgi:predicted permease
MRIPAIEGRSFAGGDASQHVAVISRATARRLWPGESAVGHRFRIGGNKEPWTTVIGVVGDVSAGGPLDHNADDMQFYQLSDTGFVAPTLVVRTRGDPAAIVPAVRRELAAIDRGAALTYVAVVRDAMAATIARPRFTMVLLAIFAGVALLLSTIGLYGVIAYAVSQRTREIGVRVALGARPRDVVRLVLTQGLTLALVGIVLGLLGAAGATRALRSLLFEVQPGDPTTFLVVGTILTAVTLVASYVPARRAATIDPVVALRAEG